MPPPTLTPPLTLPHASQLPSICVWGCASVAAIYAMMNFAYLSVLPTDTVVESSTIGVAYANQVGASTPREPHRHLQPTPIR